MQQRSDPSKPSPSNSEDLPRESSAKQNPHAKRDATDRVMNQPTGSPAGAASAGLGQTAQSGERARGANPDQPGGTPAGKPPGTPAGKPPGTPAAQPRHRTLSSPPGEPYNDDTEPRH